ncbi:MAG: hypothetical protein LBK29_00100 [Oscillospiraceae bacterium]|jgi:hypothetical protein|nr:hypothetical protein [Oscillospiraceae bacterium]
MFNNLQYLEAGGEKFPLAFTMNVMEAIQKKYGSINKISEMGNKSGESKNEESKSRENKNIKSENGENRSEENKSGEPDIEAIIFFLKEAINEGIDIENEKLRKKREFLTEKQVGRLLSEAGISNAFKAIGKVISESVKTTETGKNAEPAKNQK